MSGSTWVYALPYLLTSLGLIGVLVGDVWTFTGAVLILGIHPLLDGLIGTRLKLPAQINPKLGNGLLYFFVPVQATCLGLALYQYMKSNLWWEQAGIVLTAGILTGAFGITIAHELIHRNKPWERGLGLVLLSMVNYCHYRIEHIIGHHRHVGTPEDVATAKRGQTVYAFWLRSVFGGLLHAWRFEYSKQGLSLKNRMLHYILVTLGISCALYASLGVTALIFWWSQGCIAVILLESINYVEHYGLERKITVSGRREAVSEAHSWDSESFLTNISLFNLGRHAHHHAQAADAFSKLTPKPKAPELPVGYSFALLTVFFPPVWRRLMHPQLDRLNA